MRRRRGRRRKMKSIKHGLSRLTNGVLLPSMVLSCSVGLPMLQPCILTCPNYRSTKSHLCTCPNKEVQKCTLLRLWKSVYIETQSQWAERESYLGQFSWVRVLWGVRSPRINVSNHISLTKLGSKGYNTCSCLFFATWGQKTFIVPHGGQWMWWTHC